MQHSLKSFACKPSQTKGRRFQEKDDPYRTHFQRDRDRILYSTAFRRMQYKTQVYVTHEADFYRTRLTHTIEVMQHARTIARILQVNEDLVESISLAHDLGHAPFGHGGEEELNELMKDYGGFDHNLQSLRISDQLEKRYIEFDGLNLCYETREGLAKHVTHYDNPATHPEFKEFPGASLETQIVNWADPLAFCTHDLDDALNAGFISIEELQEYKIGVVNRNIEKLGLTTAKGEEFDIKKKLFIRNLIEEFTINVISATQANLHVYNPQAPDDIRMIRSIVAIKPQLMPWVTQRRWNQAHGKGERWRVVCDFLSGMTDRYAMETYNRLFEPNEKVMQSFK